MLYQCNRMTKISSGNGLATLIRFLSNRFPDGSKSSEPRRGQYEDWEAAFEKVTDTAPPEGFNYYPATYFLYRLSILSQLRLAMKLSMYLKRPGPSF